jgi:hypothetical protein
VHIGLPIEFSPGVEPPQIAETLERLVADLGQDKEKKEIAKARAAGG